MLKIIKQLDCGCKIAENAVRVFCDACEERILYGQPNIKGDNSFDYPVSYVYRSYEAEINDGVDLPYLKEDRPAQISNVVRNSPIAKPTPRQVYLQQQINALNRVVKEHIQRSIKPGAKRQAKKEGYLGTEIDEAPSNSEDKRL